MEKRRCEMFIDGGFALPCFVPDENGRVVYRLMNVVIDITFLSTRISNDREGRAGKIGDDRGILVRAGQSRVRFRDDRFAP